MTSLGTLLSHALLLVILASGQIQVQAQNLIRDNFRYSFFGIPSEPSLESISEMLCLAHNLYYTSLYQEALANEDVLFTAQDISWNYTESAAFPLEVSLSRNVTAADGSDSPYYDDIVSLAVVPITDFRFFIEVYLWPLGGLWNDVQAINVDSKVEGPVENPMLEEAQCDPTTTAPSDEIAGLVDPTTASPTSEIATLSPTSTSTVGAATQMPTVEGGLQTETLSPTVLQEEAENVTSTPTLAGATLSPAIMPGENLATFAPTLANATLSPTATPGEGDPITSSPSLAGATLSPTASLGDRTSSPTVDTTISAPTGGAPTLPGGGLLFELTYSFATTPLDSPTIEEVESLMCQTDRFFQDQIRQSYDDNSIVSFGTFIDWSLQNNNVLVTFLTNTTTATGSEIPPLSIVTAMQVNGDDVQEYISDYISEAVLPENNIFLGTTDVEFASSLYSGQLLRDDLGRASCPYNLPVETTSPTLSASDASGSLAPTVAPFLGDNMTMAPTVFSTDDLASDNIFTVQAPFIVSNLEGITNTRDVLSNGLLLGWRLFAQDSVENITVFENLDGRRSLVEGMQRRRLASFVSNSAVLSKVERMRRCPDGSHPDATCHDVTGEFKYEIDIEEDPNLVNQTYTNATMEALEDGTFQTYVENASPGTPLVIGLIEATPTQAPVAPPSGLDPSSPTIAGRPIADIEIAFLISNLVNITDSAEVMEQGLNESWPLFVDKIVRDIGNSTAVTRLRRRLASPTHRVLQALYLADSAEILEVTEETCPTPIRIGSTCHVALGKYALILEQGSDSMEVAARYRNETETTIYDGTYYDILKQVDPDSPLYFGVLYPLPQPQLLQIIFDGDVNQAPTRYEIDVLVCNLHDFLQDEMEKSVEEDTKIAMRYLEWEYAENELGPNRWELKFSVDVTDVETGEPLNTSLVSAVLDSAASSPDRLLQDCIKNVSNENVFSQSDVAILSRGPTTLGSMVDMLQCPLASLAPTLSPSPSLSPAPSPTPSIAPVETGPVTSPSQFLSTGAFDIKTEFLVSNLDDITNPDEVKAKGLTIAWPVYAREIVGNISVFANPTESISKRRQLSVLFFPGSAEVTDVQQVSCDEGSHKDAVCHNAQAVYSYEINQEIMLVVNETYYEQTEAGLYNGTFQNILERESPGTPLIIGTILPDGNVVPPGSDNIHSSGNNGDKDGLAGWAIFLIVLAVLLCLCLGLWAFLFFCMQKEDDKHLQPYQDEDFAYDFFIPKNVHVSTEADDVQGKAVDVDEDVMDESTASSGSPGAEMAAVPPPEEPVDIEEDDSWEDGDDEEETGWQNEGEDVLALEAPSSDEKAMEAVALLKNEADSGDEKWKNEEEDEEWDDEPDMKEIAANIGSSEFAKESHALLLSRNNDEFDSGEMQAADPPQEFSDHPDPSGDVPDKAAPEEFKDEDDDNDAHQATFNEAVASENPWGDLQAAVESTKQKGADSVAETEQLNSTSTDSVPKPVTKTPSVRGMEWAEKSENDDGWDDVDDSSQSHGTAEEKWA